MDTLDVDASLGDVTLHGGPSTPSASNNSDGIFFGRDGSGETANGELEIGTLYGGARSVVDGNSVRWRIGGALAIWGGNTVHVSVVMPNPNDSLTPTSTAKLVFLWKNDTSDGSQPGAIISSVSVEALACHQS